MKFNKKRTTIQKEKNKDKIHYKILIGLLIIGVLYYLFFEPNLIGNDSRYTYYIFLTPIAIGIVVLLLYRKDFLIYKLNSSNNLKNKIFILVFYGLQGILFSYLLFGQIAKISWDKLNESIAEKNPEEVLICEITRFWITRFWSSKSSNQIEFQFENKFEKFNISYSTIKEYLNKNPKDYYLKIDAKKGIWNYYLVYKWEIIPIKTSFKTKSYSN